MFFFESEVEFYNCNFFVSFIFHIFVLIMETKRSYNILKAIGVVVLIIVIIKLFQKLHKNTSTKLYDSKALKELENDRTFKDVYGRERIYRMPETE